MKPNEVTTETIHPEYRANSPKKTQRVQSSAATARTTPDPDASQGSASEPAAEQSSPTVSAMREFLQRVKSIEGIIVKLHGEKPLADQTIVVEVPSITSPLARMVVRLQGEMYRKYPGANVRVNVDEVKR